MKSTLFWIALFLFSYGLETAMVQNQHQGLYMTSDSEGYYMYLPALFIYGTFENIPVNTKYEYRPYPNTQKIATRFTYGVALMEAPFFGIAQLSRKIQGYKTDQPFANDISVLLLVSGCFYMTLGLFFVYKTLSRHFENKKVVNWTFAILYLGTNLSYYGIREPAMSHAYSFCLIAALIYVLPAFWRGPSVKISLLVGFLVSLIALIRPTNAVFAVVVLLYDIRNLADFKSRISFIFQNLKTLWLVPFVGILMALPQMAYWHYLSGKWFLNLYWETFQVGFNWTKPEFYKILFHGCNGFLLYTPLMWFTLVGMAWSAFKNQLNGVLSVSIFLISYYLFACWQVWWLGHAFGYRAFIDLYPLMIFGLAFYIQQLFNSKMVWFKYLNLSVFIFFMVVNMRLLIVPFYWQVDPDGSHGEELWKAINWAFDFSKWN
jgi:hypothetical protein